MVRIGFICPTHREGELHEYTASALRSFFQTTAGGVAIVVDDASPDWKPIYESHYRTMAEYDGQECYVHRFQEWGGLTRSWNKGLQLARELECDYVICGNNDIVFPRLWHQGLLHALENGYHMVGPVSNAAGPTAKQHQEVWQYFPEYEVDDSGRQIDKVQAYLLKHHLGHVIDHHVNGFFQMAALGTWWEGAYDSENVYCPRNEKTSRGHNNATPLMTLNEDELQGRWRRLGFKSGVVPSSFIFHYRAVTRGNRYRKGRWHRKQAL